MDRKRETENERARERERDNRLSMATYITQLGILLESDAVRVNMC